MSMLGMFDVVCLLWGGTTFNGFSIATSPILYNSIISEWGYFPIAKPKGLRCFVQRLRWSVSEAILFVRAVEGKLTVALRILELGTFSRCWKFDQVHDNLALRMEREE